MDKTLSVSLGPVDQISLGQGLCFVIHAQEIAVFRTRQGKLFAIENRCPHRQGPLSEGIVGDGKVVCPLHGHKFDLATGKGSEAGECVKTHHVREENGQIIFESFKKGQVL